MTVLLIYIGWLSAGSQEYATAMAHLKEEISNVHPEQATKILEELKFQV